MVKIEIAFDDADARDLLERLRSRLGETENLHDAMGTAVADTVRTHLATKKSPNTGFWSRVADSVTHEAGADRATVSIPATGAALRYYGGTVRQKPGGPLLTIPTDDVPVRDNTRLAARDMGILAYLPSRRPATKGAAGVLVEGETYTTRKGTTRTRPKPGGKLLYILRTMTEHRPDPTVLPTDLALAESARDAALDYVAAEL